LNLKKVPSLLIYAPFDLCNSLVSNKKEKNGDRSKKNWPDTESSSHGEGRFIASDELIKQLMEKGQIATQYVDIEGNPTMDVNFNPNGSMNAIEGVTSPDGRILGKMGHTERISSNTAINIPGDKNQKLFQSGVDYFG
jgi:phosphoribosylformylglycinamidine synthase